MASFGKKVQLEVEGEANLRRAGPKQIIASEADEVTEKGRTSRGLLTPETTPGPESNRLEADKARREAETTKAMPAQAAPQITSGEDSVMVTAGEEDQTKSSQIAATPDAPPNGISHDSERKYTVKQKNAVDRVLKCDSKKYYQILGVKDPSAKKDSRKAYKMLALLVHPDKNPYKGAEEAFKSKQDSMIIFAISQAFLLLFLYNTGLTSTLQDLRVQPKPLASKVRILRNRLTGTRTGLKMMRTGRRQWKPSQMFKSQTRSGCRSTNRLPSI